MGQWAGLRRPQRTGSQGLLQTVNPLSDLDLIWHCFAQHSHWDRIWIPLDLLQRRSYKLTQNLKTNFKGGLLCLLCCSMSSFAWLPVKNYVICLCSSSPVWNELFELFFSSSFQFSIFLLIGCPSEVCAAGGRGFSAVTQVEKKRLLISCALTSLFLSFIYIYGLFTTPGCELWDWLFK